MENLLDSNSHDVLWKCDHKEKLHLAYYKNVKYCASTKLRVRVQFLYNASRYMLVYARVYTHFFYSYSYSHNRYSYSCSFTRDLDCNCSDLFVPLELNKQPSFVPHSKSCHFQGIPSPKTTKK